MKWNELKEFPEPSNNLFALKTIYRFPVYVEVKHKHKHKGTYQDIARLQYSSLAIPLSFSSLTSQLDCEILNFD